jgi:predicted DNA-binding protein with PD1-like motif
VESKLLNESDGRRTYVAIFAIGDEVVRGLLDLAAERQLKGSHFTGLGAFQNVVLGWFDMDAKEYRRIPISDQVEVISFVGNIALAPDGKAGLHAHVAVARRDGSAYGGHLLEAHVRPTLEVIITEEPVHLQRTFDRQKGLALLSASV